MRIKSFKKLFHVGAMRPELKNAQGFSMEGAGLSVSEVPEAWRKIARLGNGPAWELTKPENKFLHWLGLSEADRQAVFNWGSAQGLVQASTLYFVSWYDSEIDDEVAFIFDTKEQALQELGSEEEAEEDGRKLTEQPGWTATAALATHCGFTRGPLPPAHVEDMLAIAYAEAVGLDGVFWNETFDVGALSAPRAVIVLGQLPSWTVKPQTT